MTDLMKTARDLNASNIPTLMVDGWATPATRYRSRKVGTAQLQKHKWRCGIYIMEGVGGYAAYALTHSIRVTELSIDGKVWMVDDPLHWYGMKALGEAASGRVLVVGLGLGLVVHALAQNPNVECVDVVEINPDVIRLVKHNLPKNRPYWCRVHQADFWNLATGARFGMKEIARKWFRKFDTAILDLWTTSFMERPRISTEMMAAVAMMEENGFKGRIFIWGVRSPEMNPSVRPLGPEASQFLRLLAGDGLNGTVGLSSQPTFSENARGETR